MGESTPIAFRYDGDDQEILDHHEHAAELYRQDVEAGTPSETAFRYAICTLKMSLERLAERRGEELSELRGEK